MSTARIAFYKGEGNIVDKAIRWWTKSKYSHVEVVIDGMWYSTSPRDLKLAGRKIFAKSGNWELVDVELDMDRVEELYEEYRGAKYDWTGIVLSQVLRLDIDSPNRLFCSEWAAMCLGLDDANRYSPEDVHRYLVSGVTR